MGSLLKNQILKHLSKFAKNLSPDKINISTFKGEGELNNLELDENVLMDLLELPTWMKLIKAFCNKVSLKVQWTKLKSQPICLYLDEVILEIETCAEPRSPNNSTQPSANRSEGRYGFVDKVIDGIFVHINSVSVQFNSEKFQANLQLSRVKVQSLTPIWSAPTDIRQTRIRSEHTDEIILFKEVDWQTTRIEANAREDENSLPSTPLRLIANQSKIRIVLKKRLSDCSMIASRIILLLDDILWVLTDTQLKAAMLYASSLSAMIEKSSEQSKRLAADKLQKQGNSSGADQFLLQEQQKLRHKNQTSGVKMFQKFDVRTTSFHLISSRIDLHLCDDRPTDRDCNPDHNKIIDGGSMQITLCKFSIDYYPFHYAGGERKDWHRYSDNQGSRNTWIQELFKQFRAEVRAARETCKVGSPSHTSPSHKPPASNSSPPVRESHTHGQKPARPRLTKLLESCFVLKIEEFIIYMVSTADNRRSSPKKFFSSDKKALHLPAEMSMVHIEYTDYFFTEGTDYPVPHPNMYILINPVRLQLDYLTVLWANYFSLNFLQDLESQLQSDVEKKLEHVDIKIEALMPKIVISAEQKVDNQPDRPNSLQIQISKLTASNTHLEERLTMEDLKTLLDQYTDCDMLRSGEFPNDSQTLASIPKIFHDFANSRINPYLCNYAYDLIQGQRPDSLCDTTLGTDAIQQYLRTNTLKRDQRCDIWGVCLDQVWLEFLGVPTSRTRPVPFVESFPLTLWICQANQVPDSAVLSRNGSLTKGGAVRCKNPLLRQYYSVDDNDINNEAACSSSASSDKPKTDVQFSSFKVADCSIVGRIGNKIRAQLSNPQYVFLMRLIDSISNLQTQINADMKDFKKTDDKSPSMNISFPLVLPEVEFAIVCPYIAELLPLSDPALLLQENSPDELEGKPDNSDQIVADIFDFSGNSADYITAGCDSYDLQNNTIPVCNEDGRMLGSYTETHIPHSRSDSTILCHSQESQLTDKSSYGQINSHSTEDMSQPIECSNLEVIGQNVMYTGSDSSGLSTLDKDQPRLRSGSKLTPTSMKKSITTGVTSFSNFMGKMKNKLEVEDNDEFDSISVKTDTSEDDDFEFVALDEGEMPAFVHPHLSDTTSSTDDDMSSVFAESTAASRAKEFVSAVVFRLSSTALFIQTIEDDIVVSLQTKCVDCEQTGNIVYEDFYNKLSASQGVIRSTASVNEGRYPVKFKMLLGPTAEKLVDKGAELGLMEVRLVDYEFIFRMSSILNLASFIEDEKAGVPTPMHVTIHDFRLTLEEDRPPHRPMINAQPPPVQLNIHKLLIQRHDDGVFHMTTDFEGLMDITKTDLPLSNGSEFTTDNDLQALTSRTDIPTDIVATLDKLQDENSQLKTLLLKVATQAKQQKQDLEALKKKERLWEVERRKKNETQENGDRSEPILTANHDTQAISNDLPITQDTQKLTQVNLELEKDNNSLMERLVTLEEELKDVKLEKESLISTLQLMQDELLASEQVRQRKSDSFSQS